MLKKIKVSEKVRVLLATLTVIAGCLAPAIPVHAAGSTLSQVNCLGGCGTPELHEPNSLAIDSSNNIFELDGGNFSIQKLDSGRHIIARFSQYGTKDGDNQGIYSIAVSPITGDVFASDSDNKIIQFDNDGTFIRTFGWGVQDGSSAYQKCTSGCQGGIGGSGDGQLNGAQSIAFDSHGTLYAVSRYDNRVMLFDGNGNFLSTFGWGVIDTGGAPDTFLESCTSGCQEATPGGGDGQLEQPTGIAIDISHSNKIYVADTSNHRINVYDSSFHFLVTYGVGVQDGSGSFQTCTSGCQTGAYASGPGRFANTRGVAVDNDGNFYVLTGRYDVEQFNASGTYMARTSQGCDAPLVLGVTCEPSAIVAKPSGGIFIADDENNNITAYNNYLTTPTEVFGAGYPQEAGSAAGQFTGASGVAYDQYGTMYVMDSANSRVQIFDENGTFVKAFGWGVVDTGGAAHAYLESCTTACQGGTSGDHAGQFSNYSQGIAVMSDGTIVVTDSGNNRVQEFSSTGSFIRMFGWGVQDGSAALQTCTSNCQTGLSGTGVGQLDYPSGIGLDSVDNIYVSDTNNSRIIIFAPDGTYLEDFSSYGSGDGQLDHPRSISVMAGTGYTAVADSGNNRVVIFNSFSGHSFNRNVGIGSTNGGLLSAPTGLVYDDTGKLYVADEGNDRIMKYNSTGNFIESYDTISNGGTNMLNAPSYIGTNDDGGLGVITGYESDSHYASVIVLCDSDETIDACTPPGPPSGGGGSPAQPTDSGTTTPVEDAGPNGGDANDSTHLDSTEPEVTSLVDPVSHDYAVLQSDCSSNTGVSVASEATRDGTYSYPAGLMNFTLHCSTPGYTATVTQLFYGNFVASKYIARKYSSVTHSFTTITGAVLSNVVIGGQPALKIVYHITDGSSLDEDGLANGIIVDPSGPAEVASASTAVKAPNTGIQELNMLPSVLMTLAGACIAAGAVLRRRKSKHSPTRVPTFDLPC